jgi:hypothetical protein
MNHVTTDCVDGTGICAHHDSAHGEGCRREHHFLSGYDPINRYEFRLDDLLKIGYFLLKKEIMIYKSVSIILNADKVLETEGKPAPGMGLKFRQIDKKISLRYRLRYENIIS